MNEILTLIKQHPGTTASDLAYLLGHPVRNQLSQLINRSCVTQDHETSGFYLAPGGAFELQDQNAIAAYLFSRKLLQVTPDGLVVVQDDKATANYLLSRCLLHTEEVKSA